jgi:hypothetical protein
MFKHKSLLPERGWEDYDRRADVGLSTIYQCQAYEQLKSENSTHLPESIMPHLDSRASRRLQFDEQLE